MLNKLKGFASKKLAATGSGTAIAVATGSQEAMWITIAYIVAQAVVDVAKAWKGEIS